LNSKPSSKAEVKYAGDVAEVHPGANPARKAVHPNMLVRIPGGRKHKATPEEVEKFKAFAGETETIAQRKADAKSKGPIDWDVISIGKDGKPIISWNPNTKTSKRMRYLLNPDNYKRLTGGERKERVALLDKITTEMVRSYTRYRNEAYRADGRLKRYVLFGTERKYAERAAIGCVLKGLQPVAYLKHWHTKLRSSTYAGSFDNVKYPPLTLLSSGFALEDANQAMDNEDGAATIDWKPSKRLAQSVASRVHPALRKDLIDGGYTWAKNASDERLLRLQDQAMFVLRDETNWEIVDDADADAVRHLVETTFATANPADY
jgi:hypothetical protein